MKFSKFLPTALLTLLVIVCWHIVAATQHLAILPNPIEVVVTIYQEIQGDLSTHLIVSTRRIILSLFIGVAIATPIAILTAQNQWIDNLFTPILNFLYPAPKVVFLPLIILVFGIGDQSKVFLIALIIFFQIFVIVHDAANQIPIQTLDSMRSLGSKPWHMLRYIYIPLTISAVITGVKISTGTAISVLFITETIATREGLGYYINENWTRFAYTKMYAGIFVMSALGLVIFIILSYLESYLNKWKYLSLESR